MTEAPDDEALFARLHHLHLAQSAWVWAIGDRGDEFALSKAADFVPALTLRVFAIQNHTALESLAALKSRNSTASSASHGSTIFS